MKLNLLILYFLVIICLFSYVESEDLGFDEDFKEIDELL